MRLNLSLIALGVSLLVLTFVAGYYAGYQVACMTFIEQCSAEALSDQVASALYTYYPQEQDQEQDESEGEEEKGDLEQNNEGKEGENVSPAVTSAEIKPMVPHILYEARLAGFSTAAAADRYVRKLELDGIEARVVKWETRSSRGKPLIWYQVVTGQKSYEELTKVVNFLKKRDKLEGVVFVEALQPQLQEKGVS